MSRSARNPLKLLGVTFLTHAQPPNRWRAQIIRKSKVFYLGVFADPEQAARAFDNASYYSSQYTEKGDANVNYPAEWEGNKVPPPTEKTNYMLETLRKIFPDVEKAEQTITKLDDVDALELLIYKNERLLAEPLTKMKRAAQGAIILVRRIQKENARLVKENEQLKRAVEGLKAGGAQTMMSRVIVASPGPEAPASEVSAPASVVDHHLS